MIHIGKWHMKMYSKTVLKYFDYIQNYISRKDNIYHQYFFKLYILFCSNNYLRFFSEYLYLPRYLKSGCLLLDWILYMLNWITNMYTSYFFIFIHAFISHYSASTYWITSMSYNRVIETIVSILAFPLSEVGIQLGLWRDDVTFYSKRSFQLLKKQQNECDTNMEGAAVRLGSVLHMEMR